MRTSITNGKITFAAESLGAEPWILKFNDDEVNYIWRPVPEHSAEAEGRGSPPDKSGGTPLCFPLLGLVPDGKYHLDGKEYQMGMHGFAQGCEFKIAEKNESSLLYEISETPETLAQYPYKFRFQVLYAIEGVSLKTEYRVKNSDAKELYFSVGGHPRFSCPFGGADHGKFTDYAIEFEKPEPIKNIIKSNTPLDVITRFMSADGKSFKLDYSIFEKGSFCYECDESRVVTLKDTKSSRALQMRIEGNAYFQLWTAPGNPYLAMEPWYGSLTSLPANPLVDGDWKGRPGTLHIAPGEEYVCVHYVSIRK